MGPVSRRSTPSRQLTRLLPSTKDEVDPAAMFNAIDVDGSRTVSADELEAIFSEKMPEHAKAVRMMIAAFDENGDGLINLEEGLRMHKAKANEEDNDVKIRYMFARVGDQDGSGAVSMQEYHTVMMNLGFGPDLSAKYMNENFGKYDADGDEQLNYEEFKAHMANPKSEEKKMNWFRALDKDGNGEITMAEMQMTWANLGADELADIDMIRGHTAKWDANGDGRLTFDEFKEQP